MRINGGNRGNNTLLECLDKQLNIGNVLRGLEGKRVAEMRLSLRIL